MKIQEFIRKAHNKVFVAIKYPKKFVSVTKNIIFVFEPLDMSGYKNNEFIKIPFHSAVILNIFKNGKVTFFINEPFYLDIDSIDYIDSSPEAGINFKKYLIKKVF